MTCPAYCTYVVPAISSEWDNGRWAGIFYLLLLCHPRDNWYRDRRASQTDPHPTSLLLPSNRTRLISHCHFIHFPLKNYQPVDRFIKSLPFPPHRGEPTDTWNNHHQNHHESHRRRTPFHFRRSCPCSNCYHNSWVFIFRWERLKDSDPFFLILNYTKSFFPGLIFIYSVTYIFSCPLTQCLRSMEALSHPFGTVCSSRTNHPLRLRRCLWRAP